MRPAGCFARAAPEGAPAARHCIEHPQARVVHRDGAASSTAPPDRTAVVVIVAAIAVAVVVVVAVVAFVAFVAFVAVVQAQVISPASSVIAQSCRKATALRKPSLAVISESSCSIDSGPS